MFKNASSKFNMKRFDVTCHVIRALEYLIAITTRKILYEFLSCVNIDNFCREITPHIADMVAAKQTLGKDTIEDAEVTKRRSRKQRNSFMTRKATRMVVSWITEKMKA